MGESCILQDFLAGCNGLSRGFTVNQTADAITGHGGFMQSPTCGGQLLENGTPSSVCQGKDIYYNFVNEMIDGKAMQQFKTFLVRDFRCIDTRGVLFILFTNKIQHGIADRQHKSTFPVPERETPFVRLHPFEQFLVLTGKKAVLCHCRYDLYFCHIPPVIKKSVKLTLFRTEALTKPNTETCMSSRHKA